MHSFKCSSIVAVVAQVGVVAAVTNGNKLISGITMTTTTSESGVSLPRLDEGETVFETTSTAEENTTAEAEAEAETTSLEEAEEEENDATSSEGPWFVPDGMMQWKIGPGMPNKTGGFFEMLAIGGLCWLAIGFLELISQILFGIGEVLYYCLCAGSETRKTKEKKKNKRNAQDAKDAEADEEACLLRGVAPSSP